MSWERKRIELKKAEARQPHGDTENADRAMHNACCLWAILDTITCCWWPVLGILTLIILTAMAGH